MTRHCTLFEADLPHVRSRYQLLLQRVVRLLRGRLEDNLVSAYLIGSPGRGSGTLIAQDGAWEIANDLDLLIVVNRAVRGSVLIDLMKESTGLANPGSRFVRDKLSEVDFHIDIVQLAKKDLCILGPSMLNVDFAFAGLLLEGAEVRSEIRITPLEIPVFEGYLLLYNRLCSLIETVRPEHIVQPRGNKSNSWIASYYFAKKMILDSGAAALIGGERYAPAFGERTVRLKELSNEWASRYAYWTQSKTVLDVGQLVGAELAEAWLEAHRWFGCARAALGLQSMDGARGVALAGAVVRWVAASVQAEKRMRHPSLDAAPIKLLKGSRKALFSVPSVARRVAVYAEAETLAVVLADELKRTGNLQSLPPDWLAVRDTTIRAWKELNWR